MEPKKGKQKIFSAIFTAIIVVVVGFLMFSGSVKLTFSDDSFTLKASMTRSREIRYDAVTDIELREAIEIGSRSFGVGSMRLQAGSFSNTEFGGYSLYAYTGAECYAVVHTNDGIAVFALENTAATEEAFNKIAENVG